VSDRLAAVALRSTLIGFIAGFIAGFIVGRLA
jgi:hypothetical protein